MSMQEFEQEERKQVEQREGHQAGYVGSYEVERQKIQPYGGKWRGSALHIVVTVLAPIGFVLSTMGIVGAALVLASTSHAESLLENRVLIVGGVLGLVGSILTLLVFVAMFVVALVLLARRVALRKGAGSASLRRGSLGKRR
ncbi:MAG TPA: hypothetical protein VGD98_24530 [Ktedonobacteraceae bacterium]